MSAFFFIGRKKYSWCFSHVPALPQYNRPDNSCWIEYKFSPPEIWEGSRLWAVYKGFKVLLECSIYQALPHGFVFFEIMQQEALLGLWDRERRFNVSLTFTSRVALRKGLTGSQFPHSQNRENTTYLLSRVVRTIKEMMHVECVGTWGRCTVSEFLSFSIEATIHWLIQQICFKHLLNNRNCAKY